MSWIRSSTSSRSKDKSSLIRPRKRSSQLAPRCSHRMPPLPLRPPRPRRCRRRKWRSKECRRRSWQLGLLSWSLPTRTLIAATTSTSARLRSQLPLIFEDESGSFGQPGASEAKARLEPLWRLTKPPNMIRLGLQTGSWWLQSSARTQFPFDGIGNASSFAELHLVRRGAGIRGRLWQMR